MKIIKIIIISLTLSSCTKEKKENETISDKKLEEFVLHLKLKPNKEKITLLSTIYDIDKDTLENIISSYYNTNTPLKLIPTVKDIPNYSKILDSISVKYIINKKLIAKIIYDYKVLGISDNIEELSNKKINFTDLYPE